MTLKELSEENSNKDVIIEELVEKNFKVELEKIIPIIKNMQNNTGREFVPEEDVIKAFTILNCIKYNFISDVFLGVASLNLLNTYIKQKKCKIDYSFKEHLNDIIKGIEDIGSKSIDVIYQREHNINYVYIVFWNFQFSFANIKGSDSICKLTSKKTIVFDGIRKQMSAKTIFDFSLNYKSNVYETLGGNDLNEIINANLEKYKKGVCNFYDGKLYTLLDEDDKIYHKERLDDTNKNLKNFNRTKLIECQDRPVILIGKLKKIWENHITFITIRPYIEGVKTRTICNHINIYRQDVEKILNISDLVLGERYYIVCYCKPYETDKSRMGVKLALDCTNNPIMPINQKISGTVVSKCHRFSIEDYALRNHQIKL